MVLAEKLRRPKALAAAALLIVASVLPLLAPKAHAYGLVGTRKITMSSSADGTLAAGQDVTYEVSFTVATDTTNIQGLVVDFCANSPIIGEACTAPTGFDLDPTNLAVTVNAGLTTFTKNASESDTNTLVLNGSSAWDPGVAATATFTLGTAAANDGVDNPENTNTTFYARIITFTTTTGANDYNSATVNANNPGAEPPVVDAGGIAMSTANQITITSKVQEKLTFCVYTSAVNYTSCSGVTGTAVTLGDTNGVLDTAGPYVDKTTKFNIATNASQGAAVRVRGDTLKTGSFDIAPTGSGATSAAGTEQFGFCSYRDAGGGSTGLTATTPYDSASCSGTTQTAGTGTTGGTNGATFAFDNNTSTGTLSTYGMQFASKGAGDFSTGVLAFVGNIANTTEAGIYSTTLTFIATGTY